MKLNELKAGQSARVTSVGGDGALRQHFLDMGRWNCACAAMS